MAFWKHIIHAGDDEDSGVAYEDGSDTMYRLQVPFRAQTTLNVRQAALVHGRPAGLVARVMQQRGREPLYRHCRRCSTRPTLWDSCTNVKVPSVALLQ